jgi:hypothetical protein
MPFDHENPLSPDTPDRLGILDQQEARPSFSQTLGAAFRQENIVGSALSSPRTGFGDFWRIEDGYDVFADIEGYEQFADRFEEAFNPEAASAIKLGIDQEQRDRNILAASGWVGIGATIGVTLVDPTILIPGGALVKSGRLGASVLRSGVAVGATAAGATAVQEAGLQATQELRTAEDSLANIGGSAILGGFLGAGAAKAYNLMAWKAARVNNALNELDRQRIAKLEQAMQDAGRRGFGDFVSDADRASYLDELVDDIFAKVTGRAHDGDVPTELKIGARGPLKDRTFNIPDEMIEKFLDSDVEFVGRRYARLMSADIELTERFGSPDMEGAFDAVRDDYKRLRDAVEKGSMDGAAKQKALERLSAREKADIRDLQGVRDIIRGHYRPEIPHTTWARIGRAANAFNYMRALGGVVISSLTDAVRPAMVHGLNAYMGQAIRPLVKNLDAVKLSKSEAVKAGAIAERVLASRLATLYGSGGGRTGLQAGRGRAPAGKPVRGTLDCGWAFRTLLRGRNGHGGAPEPRLREHARHGHG